ncbi:hypothetical protein ALO46_101870 [Pseudomonas syringae pv. solidagae]|uniref:Uncharacterized protein n=1 Tax=Pseudomonas syringae pv. solidagae TaxID=264458 RepID=A0A0Q0FCU1_PSESX|nr:hypothetical protein ALO46_101870 [Pseudomonas syringae pv. solidagae]RMR52123.1 hypothetical protein ALP85_101681 [Pseudomonas syringae pv. syringae]RMT37731.1 hypothetical protein ALP49_101891 [Pseudomonas syringae pv. solidagae]RMT39248.1 hypothetical protein ALP48_101839 [Pseudomonas syringae pv. solidagae]
MHRVVPGMHIRHPMVCMGDRSHCSAGKSGHHLAVTDAARKTIEQDNCVQYPGNGRAMGSEDVHGDQFNISGRN